ncbi:zinc-binding dehydrogenase [Saccharopolyspora phatthalungensis]|uniref:S-(Hydroxymethyl)glutathione dehydrogenase/alcohol dehydrogenase n=1 Tax=Saccharopolyspora phatthalungensis TaxID=664693 RepID=A0A840Q113_9PSEU|nr:Zn-dependent alcohol dehydrogenase [Saccharopolyspora phatthalungensis]MBB5153660.1 S-(hydroxymethyl)glutathione dehydrogenase/alcohol dehydrogenase [Saccharopolyspora phatthalungensis]
MSQSATGTAVRGVVLDEVASGPSFTELHLAAPGPNEVEVTIAAAGVCGSDLHVALGEWNVPRPVVLGHEGAGVVTRVGENVTSLEEGDHVILTWMPQCGSCRQCNNSRPWQCEQVVEVIETKGVLYDGTTRWSRNGSAVHHFAGVSSFAEKVVVPESGAIRIRRDAPLDAVVLIGCGVATGVGAVRNTAAVPAGASVAVIGCGGVGLSCVQGARLAGAGRIVAVDVNPDKLEVAKRLGATDTVDAGAEGADVAELLRDVVPGGLDYVFDAIGRTSTTEASVAALAIGGTAVVVGLPPEGTTARFDPLALSESSRRIIGSHYGSIDPRRDIPALVDLYTEGELDLETLISARRPLSEAVEALEDLKAGRALRTVLVNAQP